MSDEFEPLYDDDGDVYGYIAEAEDGAIIGLDADGEIVSAHDPYSGEELDAGDYGWVQPEADAATELGARLDELEARLEEPRPAQFETVLTEPDEGRITNDLAEQRAQLESDGYFGRPLLLREQQAYAGRAVDHVLNGNVRPDLRAAAAELDDEGAVPLLDLDDERSAGHRHAARTEFMAERLRDLDRYSDAAAGYDDLSSPEPPGTQGAYDMDSREDRMAYYADRLRDAANVDQTYSSSDYAEEA